MKQKIDPEDKRKNKTFFNLIFPTFILGVLSLIPSVNGLGTNVIIIIVKILVVIWQYIVVRNFVDSIM